MSAKPFALLLGHKGQRRAVSRPPPCPVAYWAVAILPLATSMEVADERRSVDWLGIRVIYASGVVLLLS